MKKNTITLELTIKNVGESLNGKHQRCQSARGTPRSSSLPIYLILTYKVLAALPFTTHYYNKCNSTFQREKRSHLGFELAANRENY
jgi:hypothetical protein